MHIPSYEEMIVLIMIEIAESAGFCTGVKRAVELAMNAALKRGNEEGGVYAKGELVHNRNVSELLKRRGIVFVDRVEEIPPASMVILRAHGEVSSTYRSLRKKGISTERGNLIDATCPLVRIVHKTGIALARAGYSLIFFGKRKHPEAIATIASIRENASDAHIQIIESADEVGLEELVRSIEKNKGKNPCPRIALLSQTTMSVSAYRDIADRISAILKTEYSPLSPAQINALLGKLDEEGRGNASGLPGFIKAETICGPTRKRQEGAEKLSRRADIMVVIGGHNSSNTKELFDICRANCKDSYLVADESELNEEWFKEVKKKGEGLIGISAGASTPDWIINNVHKSIEGWVNDK